MNIALEDTKEFVDGKLRRNYGDAFVRGNNGEFWHIIPLQDDWDFWLSMMWCEEIKSAC